MSKIKELKREIGHTSVINYSLKSNTQSLASGQSYPLSLNSYGENLMVFYNGSISISGLTIDNNKIITSAIPITSNPFLMPYEWASLTLTITANQQSTVVFVYYST
jgi:hypothetical protein